MESLREYLERRLSSEEIDINEEVIIQTASEEVIASSVVEDLLDSESDCLDMLVSDDDKTDDNTLIIVVE